MNKGAYFKTSFFAFGLSLWRFGLATGYDSAQASLVRFDFGKGSK